MTIYDIANKTKGLTYMPVVMANHMHLLMRSDIGKLSDTIGECKSYSAKNLLAAIEEEPESPREWMLNLFEFAASKHKLNQKFQIWTHENHPELIYSDKFILQKINYIHNNPVRAGLVELQEDYLYSSALFYAGKPCFLQRHSETLCRTGGLLYDL